MPALRWKMTAVVILELSDAPLFVAVQDGRTATVVGNAQ
jgi:hypothetical protein